MIPATIIGVAGILTCLLGQAFFSGSEMAMVSADRLTLRTRADEGATGAALTLQLLAREDRLLGTCLIGTNLSLVAGTTLCATVLAWWGIDLALASALLYTPFALILGETLSKTVFQHYANRIAPAVAYPLRTAQIVFSPGLVVVSLWSKALDRVLGRGAREPVRREEIVGLLGDDEDPGEIDANERRLITRLFVLSETPVEEVMTPLVDVTAVPVSASGSDATAIAVESGHSRLPVFEDRIDNIVGVVHVRSLLFGEGEADVADLMEPVVFVPEQKRVDDLLAEMRVRRDPLVVVVDEYGGSVGLVTIEDLLEEVVGEILDERDEDEPQVLQLSEHEWRVPARTEVDELEDEVGYVLPEGDYETVAGFVLSAIGRIPAQGETLRIGEVTVNVEEATERAVVTVRIIFPHR